MILAGGLGTRLRSMIDDRPKAMAKVGDKVFLEYQIEFLKRYQLVELVLCVGYRHQQILEYFGDGSRWGVQIDYSIEPELLGTAGAIKHAEKYLRGSFLALNGDSFFDLDFGAFIRFHERKRIWAPRRCYLGTLALAQVQHARDYGLVRFDSEDTILEFTEKSAERSAVSNGSNWINGGIYLLEPELLRLIPRARNVSIERETFRSALSDGYRLGAYPAEGFFVDIGTPVGYHRFLEYVQGGCRDHSE